MAICTKYLEFSYINNHKERLIDQMAQEFLDEINKSNFFTSISYIIKELAGNANKANLKRIFFEDKGLDITSVNVYNENIDNFKNYLSRYAEQYWKTAEQQGYNIRVILSLSLKALTISITNNRNLLPIELERIRKKLNASADFKTIEEVFSNQLDMTEGAGYGLIIVTLLLKKLNTDLNSFSINEKKGETEIAINIPADSLEQEKTEIIAKAIAEELKNIPQFPQHILEMIAALNNPNNTFDSIAKIIKKDPGLIAELLKIANSPEYMLPKKVKNIEEAVGLIGTRAIKNIIIEYSTEKILINKYSVNIIKYFMKHSREVAFYAYNLGLKLNINNISEHTYIAAMLHDIGKIIIHAVHPEFQEKIQQICREKGLNNFLIESLTDGYSHSVIGHELAVKWNYPEFLTETIKFHHIPARAKEEYRPLANIIYLADVLFYYKRDDYNFNNIEMDILKTFQFEDQSKFQLYTADLFEQYKKMEAD